MEDKDKVYKRRIRTITAWLLGLRDAGVDLNSGFEFSYALKPEIEGAVTYHVIGDENRPDMSCDPFEPWGIWHRACNRVIFDLRDDSLKMAEHFDYPHSNSLGLGDGAFWSLMAAIKDFHIELPDAATLAAADAKREALEKAERERGLQIQKEMMEQWEKAKKNGWDDSEAYDYD